eukprot:3088657-Karenia_brevis.AAC.1
MMMRANRSKREWRLKSSPQDLFPGPQGLMSSMDMLVGAGLPVDDLVREVDPPAPPGPLPTDSVEPPPP